MKSRKERGTWPFAVLPLLLLLASTVAAQQPIARRPRAERGAEAAGRVQTFTNPIFDFDFPDPTVTRASDGWYYAYATQTVLNGKTINIQAARSKDLVRWERMPDVLPVKPRWASGTQSFWAPDVKQRGGTFYMYFSADLDKSLADDFKKDLPPEQQKEGVFCLGVATARRAGGPFADSGRPLKCGVSFVNIDPMAFDDPVTGKRLLYWGSGFQPIRVQELADDRLSFKPGSKPIELVPADKKHPYQSLVEGAWLIRRNGYYYLFFSGENCCHGPLEDIKYAVMVARSKSATGPFETLAQATGKTDSTILRRSARWIAPGHNSVVTDTAGRDWMAYHAINASKPYLTNEIGGDRKVNRVMLLDRLIYRDGWPQIENSTPSTTKRPAPSVR